MKDLSIAQEYLIFAVNEKGIFPGSNSKAIVCLIVSGLLEMQLEKCVSLKDKKLAVCAELPENMAYLKPLYDVINQGKPISAESVVEKYIVAFTNKKLNEIVDALMNSLKEADAVEPAMAGLLNHRETFVPKREIVKGITEKIRAELLEDGEISEEVVALTALMDKAGKLNDYFSRFEQKELKARLEKINNSDAGILVKQMIQYIDDTFMACMFSSVFTSVIS